MIRSIRAKQLARNYARAFFRVHNPTEKKLLADVAALTAFFNEHKIVFQMLILSSARLEDKIEALAKVVGTLKLSAPIHDLLQILIRHKTLHILPFLLPALTQIYRTNNNIHDVTVTSAQVLTSQEKQKLEASLGKQISGTLHFTYCQDEALIAGIKVSTLTLSWEDSVARTIRMLENRLRLQEQI